MQVHVYSPSRDLDREIHEMVTRRFGFALDRLAEEVGWVGVRLGESSPEAAGRSCQVKITLAGGPTLCIEEIGRTLAAAVDRAAHRAEEAVTRHLATPRRSAARRHVGDLARFETPPNDTGVEVSHVDRLADPRSRRHRRGERLPC